MTIDQERSSELRPRGLSTQTAATYIGLSATSFLLQVAAGTFPQPIPMARTRRRNWDRHALDRSIDQAQGILDYQPDREARKKAWQEERQRREMRRKGLLPDRHR